MSHLKPISFEEFKKMSEGKDAFELKLSKFRNKEDLFKGIVQLEFDLGAFFNKTVYPVVVTSTKKSFVDAVEVVYGVCVEETFLSEFEQGKSYSFIAGDPIKFKGSVEGVLVDDSGQMNCLILKNLSGDFLMFEIYKDQARFLEIVE